jgi:hypothetical protein
VSRETEEVGGGKLETGQVLVVGEKGEVVRKMEEVGKVEVGVARVTGVVGKVEVVREMEGVEKARFREEVGAGEVEVAGEMEGVGKVEMAVVREREEVETVKRMEEEVRMMEVVRAMERVGMVEVQEVGELELGKKTGEAVTGREEVEMVGEVRMVARAGVEGKGESDKAAASFSSLVSSLCEDGSFSLNEPQAFVGRVEMVDENASCALCGGLFQRGPEANLCHLEFFSPQLPQQ